MKSRALLVSPCFPPGAMAGALRWQRLSKFAAERAMGLDVITLAPESQDRVEWERLAELPAGIRVFGIPYNSSPILRSMHRLLLRFRRVMRNGARRSSTAFGEASVVAIRTLGLAEIREVVAGEWTDRRWIRAASNLGYALACATRYQTVISCGPPHIAHIAADRIARRCRLPLVIDLRDPWGQTDAATEPETNPLWLALARRYEAKLITTAALIVMNTDLARESMRSAYPAAAERIIAVMNGFDEDKIPPVEEGSTFKIVYAGSIYLDRDPSTLFEAIGRVVRTENLAREDLRIEFIGHAAEVRGVPLQRIAERAGLGAHLVVSPPCPRTELFKRLSGAAMLVSLPQGPRMCIPSKVFEYMQFPGWLLALAEESNATARALRSTAADVVDPRDIDAIEEVVKRRYREYRRGTRAIPIAQTSPQLSRRAQSDIFFTALGRCTANAEDADR